ncbi:MAG: XRE family transcriptional regulator [Kutzneria sp.]|nr:XRE family transcriptional regulator [Kutzneria sp.]
MATLADRLNTLFATVGRLDSKGRRREYSTPYVAKMISADPSHDTTVSRVYLATLRSGTNTNPTIAVVKALAKFFDEHREHGTTPITPAYLLGDEGNNGDAEERELREKLADSQVRMIAMRAGDMTPAVRRQVLKMLDVLAAAEPDESESATGNRSS